MIKIYLTDLSGYVDGRLIGEWLDLDNYDTIDDMKPIFDKYSGSEFFISDYDIEGFGFKVSERADIKELIELNLFINELEEEDVEKLKYYCCEYPSSTASNLVAVDFDNIGCYANTDIEALAELFIDDGLFGEIPKALESYIDYGAVARDLGIDGYIEFNEHVFKMG